MGGGSACPDVRHAVRQLRLHPGAATGASSGAGYAVSVAVTEPGHYADYAKGCRRGAEDLGATVRDRKAGTEESRGEKQAQAEAQKVAAAKKAEEQKQAEEARKAEAAKKAEADKAAEQKRQADIAKKRAEEEAKKKAAEEAKKKAAAEEAKKKAAAAEAAKKKAAEDARRKAAEDQKAAALAELLSDNVQNQQALAETHGDQVAGNLDDLIIKLITENWQRPMSARRGMSVELLIQMLPDGTVTNASVSRSSGDAPFDNSAVAAVRNVGRIPEMQQLDRATFDRMYRQRRVIFKPED